MFTQLCWQPPLCTWHSSTSARGQETKAHRQHPPGARVPMEDTEPVQVPGPRPQSPSQEPEPEPVLQGAERGDDGPVPHTWPAGSGGRARISGAPGVRQNTGSSGLAHAVAAEGTGWGRGGPAPNAFQDWTWSTPISKVQLQKYSGQCQPVPAVPLGPMSPKGKNQ